MFCSHCGGHLEPGSQFCSNCGSRSQVQSTSHTTTTHFGQFGGFQQQAAPQPQQQYSQSQPVYSGENTMAIAGLISSLVGFMMGLPWIGIIVSAIGLVKAKQMNGKGRGLALAGLWIGIAGTIFYILLVVGYIILIIWLGGMGGNGYYY